MSDVTPAPEEAAAEEEFVNPDPNVNPTLAQAAAEAEAAEEPPSA